MYPLQSNWKYKTIFDEFKFTTIVPDHLPLALGSRDKYSYTKAIKAIDIGENKKIFVSFPDLDGLAHKVGMDSSQYEERIEWIDNHAEKLVEKFINRYPQGRVVILSDHGMANAKEGVNFQLERKFGLPDPSKLVYFYDSLYLRIWAKSRFLKEEIVSFLQQSKVGHILTEEERAFWGLSSPELGEIIFLLKEGYAFAPNYFGLRLQRAYHGYHPKLESQKCIFLYSGSRILDEPKYLKDVYNALRRLIQIEGNKYG
jgi:predicted AlkP superfamily pyrophosphatase or phosphodiesterase